MNISFAIILIIFIFIVIELSRSLMYDEQIKKLNDIKRRKRLEDRTKFLQNRNNRLSPEARSEVREIVYEIIAEEDAEFRVSKLSRSITNGILMGALSGLIIGGDNQSAIKGAIIWASINGFLASIGFYI